MFWVPFVSLEFQLLNDLIFPLCDRIALLLYNVGFPRETPRGPMDSRPSAWTTFVATLLVGGTCIGGGMLALPVGSGIPGYLPSIVAMLACYAAMTFTGLLLVEVVLAVEGEHHMMTLADKLLGRWGRWTVWVIFLFMTYGSLIGYTAGGGQTIAALVLKGVGLELSEVMSGLLLAGSFGVICAMGTRVVGSVNGILFGAMVVTYILLVLFGVGEVSAEKLSRTNWKDAWMPLPIMLTGFSVQAFLIPSLAAPLKRDPRALRLAVVGGLGLAFVIYLLWQTVVLGVVPLSGPYGLDAALERGEDAAKYLQHAVEHPWIATTALWFGFLALITSFLGMGLGLVDFLRDSFKIPRGGSGLILVALLLVVPTLFCATYFERVFIQAFDLTGGFGDTILNGMLPVLMVWQLRYVLHSSQVYRVAGGRPVLIAAFIFYAAIFLLEFCRQVGWFVPDYIPETQYGASPQ